MCLGAGARFSWGTMSHGQSAEWNETWKEPRDKASHGFSFKGTPDQFLLAPASKTGFPVSSQIRAKK